MDSVETSVVDCESGLKSHEITLKSNKNDSKFTETNENYVQSMISWTS